MPDKTLFNGSGCVDHTAHKAMNNVTREERKAAARDEAAEVLVKSIKNMIWLSGFRLIDRIRFEDPQSGKKYQ